MLFVHEETWSERTHLMKFYILYTKWQESVRVWHLIKSKDGVMKFPEDLSEEDFLLDKSGK